MWFRTLIICLGLALLSSCLDPLRLPPTGPPVVQDSGENLFLEAEQSYRRQEYRQAWQKYAAYLHRHPKGPKALRARLREAELLGLLGDWPGALLKYQGLLQAGVEGEVALQARYGLGRASFKLGRYQQAADILESLTALALPGPLAFATNAMLTEVALKKGGVEPAFVRLRLAARDLAAGDQEWFEDLEARLVEQSSPAELEHLANLYRDTPLTAPLLLRLARLAQEQNRPADSRKWLEILKERFPESKAAQTGLAELAASRPLIACLLPFSGNNADFGNRVKQGMELAAQGTPLELVYRDCPGDPDTASRLVQELAQDSRVLALLGPLTSGDAQAAAQSAQAGGIPLLALSQKQDLTTVGPLIHQIFLTPRLQVRSLLRYTLGGPGLRRYALMAPDSPYGRTFGQLFREELQTQGGILVQEATYPPGSTDFDAALSSLFPGSPPGGQPSPPFDALFIPDDAATVAAIATHLEEVRLGKVKVLGTNLAHPREAGGEEAQALDGILFPEAFFEGDPNPAVQGFIAAFRQRYGTAPDYLAAQGYMVVRLLSHLAETQGPLSRGDLPHKLASLREVPNLPWFRGLTPERQADLALYILTLKNGQVEMVTTPGAGHP